MAQCGQLNRTTQQSPEPLNHTQKGTRIMSQKFYAQHSELVKLPFLPPVNRRTIILILVATVLVLALAFVMAGQSATSNDAANINQPSTIPYGNALEMQYAQQYLNSNIRESAVNVPYNNALELQYAQPYLNNSAANSVPFGNALEMQYAQPYLNNSAVNSVPFGNALQMQYAQPYLNSSAADNVTYGNALEMQYARPYLND
jgi:hypothetical protein